MDLPIRRTLPHAIPPWVDERSFFFITICCAERARNHLAQSEIGNRILSTAAFYHDHLRWHCRLFLLMPDHVHSILCFPRDPGMETTIRAWKGYVKRFHGVDWQSDFFDHRLRDRFEMDEKTSYVLNNPVRAGLCARAEDWTFVYRPMDRLL